MQQHSNLTLPSYASIIKRLLQKQDIEPLYPKSKTQSSELPIKSKIVQLSKFPLIDNAFQRVYQQNIKPRNLFAAYLEKTHQSHQQSLQKCKLKDIAKLPFQPNQYLKTELSAKKLLEMRNMNSILKQISGRYAQTIQNKAQSVRQYNLINPENSQKVSTQSQKIMVGREFAFAIQNLKLSKQSKHVNKQEKNSKQNKQLELTHQFSVKHLAHQIKTAQTSSIKIQNGHSHQLGPTTQLLQYSLKHKRANFTSQMNSQRNANNICKTNNSNQLNASKKFSMAQLVLNLKTLKKQKTNSFSDLDGWTKRSTKFQEYNDTEITALNQFDNL